MGSSVLLPRPFGAADFSGFGLIGTLFEASAGEIAAEVRIPVRIPVKV